MRKTILFLLLFGAGLCGTSWATENGGGAYANGSEDFAVGYCTRPGFYFFDYFLFYKAERFNNKNGDNFVPGFDVEGFGNGFRLLYITEKKILGGNWGMHATIPLASLTVKAAGTEHNSTGLGDIIINPLIIGWSKGDLFYAFGSNLYFPTGEFDKTRPSIGRNYFTYEPFISASYLTANGWDLSGIFYYDVNTKNPDTGYLSGHEFHFDYSIGKRFGRLSLGAGGFFYQQVTDDKVNGVKVGTDGNKGRAFAIGPEVRYLYKNISLVLKYQKEFEVKNRPEGHKSWLKLMYIF